MALITYRGWGHWSQHGHALSLNCPIIECKISKHHVFGHQRTMTRPDVLWGSKGRSSHGQDSEIGLVVPKLMVQWYILSNKKYQWGNIICTRMLIYWSFTTRASKYFLSLWTISYVPPACFAECGFLRKLRQKIQAELLYRLPALHIRWLSWLSWYVIKCTEHCTCPSWPAAVAFKRKLNFDPGLMFPF